MRRLRQLEEENRRLKSIWADQARYVITLDVPAAVRDNLLRFLPADDRPARIKSVEDIALASAFARRRRTLPPEQAACSQNRRKGRSSSHPDSRQSRRTCREPLPFVGPCTVYNPVGCGASVQGTETIEYQKKNQRDPNHRGQARPGRPRGAARRHRRPPGPPTRRPETRSVFCKHRGGSEVSHAGANGAPAHDQEPSPRLNLRTRENGQPEPEERANRSQGFRAAWFGAPERPTSGGSEARQGARGSLRRDRAQDRNLNDNAAQRIQYTPETEGV